MRITTQKDDEITKVFMGNTYVGYIEGEEMFAFDTANTARKVNGIHSVDRWEVVAAYIRLRKPDNEAISIIGFLAAQLSTHDPNSPIIKTALDYLRRKSAI